MGVPAKKQETAPANAMSEELRKLAEQNVGAGSSAAKEDNLIPLIYVLQGLSPQVNKRNDAYIDGAEAGDVWLRNASKPIVKGTEGIIFQPCHFSKNWVEWVPREDGGGRRGIYDFDALIHEKKVNEGKEFDRAHLKTKDGDIELKVSYKDGNPNVPIYKLPNGNELVETRYHTGFVVDGEASLPYVISFKSTGHTVSREWMGKILQHNSVNGRDPDPAWLYFYRLKTRHRKNKEGEWFIFSVSEERADGKERVASVDEYRRGLGLYNAMIAGEKQVGEEENDEAMRQSSADAPL